eukprot:3135928-Pyramimonas_sp.AAC.1
MGPVTRDPRALSDSASRAVRRNQLMDLGPMARRLPNRGEDFGGIPRGRVRQQAPELEPRGRSGEVSG